MVAQPFTVDLNKPLVFQVGHLGEAYQEWVHQPIVSKEGPRFFESDFFEFLTRTVWWVIPLIWLPVVCWSVLMSIQMGHTLPEVALLVVTGVFIWTLMEYSLHRFLFHIKTKGYWTNTAHYLLHGCHHKHPMDGLRLVFPPAATAILCVPFGSLLRLTTSFGGNSHLQQTISMVIYFFAINNLKERLNIYHFEGGLLGYVMYDVTHYYLHHGQPSGEVTRNMKRYHLNHHFRIQNRGFGITSSLWDNVFGTHPSSKAADKNR